MRRLIAAFILTCAITACNGNANPFHDTADTDSQSCRNSCRHDNDVCMDQTSAPSDRDTQSPNGINPMFSATGECSAELSSCLNTCAHTLP